MKGRFETNNRKQNEQCTETGDKARTGRGWGNACPLSAISALLPSAVCPAAKRFLPRLLTRQHTGLGYQRAPPLPSGPAHVVLRLDHRLGVRRQLLAPAWHLLDVGDALACRGTTMQRGEGNRDDASAGG